MQKLGIDLSTYQKEVDWQKVKDAGIAFAILRAGFGNSVNQQDSMFETHMKGALAVGLPVGVYWFNYCLSEEDARKEAKACLQVLAPYKGKILLPVFADYEGDSDRYAKENGVTPTKESRTAWIRAFCDEIEKGGFTPGVYTNPDFIRNKLLYEELKDYPLWLAQYGVDTPAYPCDYWQYTSTGQLAGVSGNVDMNRAGDVPVQAVPDKAPSKVPTKKASVTYRVRGQSGTWYPPVYDLQDFAGVAGDAITDVAVKVSAGKVRYRVHVKGGAWLPWVTGYDVKDAKNGYAGNGQVIDAIAVYYETPAGQPVKKAKYRVAPLRGEYYAWQLDEEKTGGQDGYAGTFGKAIDRLQITLA